MRLILSNRTFLLQKISSINFNKMKIYFPRIIVAVISSILSLISPISAFSQYKLIKKDGLKVDSQLPVQIIDFNTSSNFFLGFIDSNKGGEIALLNSKGEILVQKEIVGEGPNKISSAFNNLAFSNESEIWVQGPYELLLLDLKLNIKQKTRYISETKMHLYGRVEPFSYFNSQSGFSFIINPNRTSKFLDRQEFFDKSLIEIFELNNGKSYELAQVSERKISKILDKSVGAIYFPIYLVDKDTNTLFLTTSLDNEITIYDLNTRKLKSRINISHGKFLSFNSSISLGHLPSYKGRINLAGKNDKLLLLDNDCFVLDYINEISLSSYENKISEDPTYHHFQDPNYHRLILFDQTKQLSGDIPMPKNGHLMIALPGNRLLFRIDDPDVEEDFIRYEIYEIVKR